MCKNFPSFLSHDRTNKRRRKAWIQNLKAIPAHIQTGHLHILSTKVGRKKERSSMPPRKTKLVIRSFTILALKSTESRCIDTTKIKFSLHLPFKHTGRPDGQTLLQRNPEERQRERQELTGATPEAGDVRGSPLHRAAVDSVVHES